MACLVGFKVVTGVEDCEFLEEEVNCLEEVVLFLSVLPMLPALEREALAIAAGTGTDSGRLVLELFVLPL